MSRSKWKSFYTDTTLIGNNFKISRNSKITPKFVGLTLKVYNGKTHKEVTVTQNMLNHKFGEFSFTRKRFFFKKKKSKK